MRSDQFTIIAQYLCSEMGLGLIRTRLSHVNLVPFRSNLKIKKNRPQGARGWGSEFYFFTRIFIYISKNLNSYDNPLLGFNNGGKKKKEKRKEKYRK